MDLPFRFKRRKIPSKWLMVIGVLLFVLVIEVIFKRPFWGDAKQRVYQLLHHNQPIKVDNYNERLANIGFLKKYYDRFGYKQNWTDTTGESDKYRDMLIVMLKHADSLGLDRNDYHPDYITRYDSLSHLPNFDYAEYESENELIFSDAAISFLFHVAYGKEIKVGFNGVKYNIDSAHIINMYNNLLVHKNWRSTLDSIEPKTAQYLVLKRELNRMQSILAGNPAIDTSTVVASDSKDVAIEKLKAYGFIEDSLNADAVIAVQLKKAVKGFQKMMSLDTTGEWDKKTLAAINFPLSVRVKQVKESLNYWRWTGRLRERNFILVNIPAARLQIVDSDSIKDVSMRVIVGKSATRTPEFTAYISKVITYPYWTVPLSIATKEMLPKIRRDVNYLEENNLQVLTPKGVEIDPKTINWSKYSEKYFPFIIRQSTGCDNSLGVLKFDLNSPYSIYLHDTNHRELFGKKDRFLSHGCVRVEKPMVLAEFILQQGLDTSTMAELNRCMKEEKPSEFKLKKLFPVLIFYMTADVDETNHLKFYNDIYGNEEEAPKEKKPV